MTSGWTASKFQRPSGRRFFSSSESANRNLGSLAYPSACALESLRTQGLVEESVSLGDSRRRE